MADESPEKKGLPIFFKVRQVVKKAYFNGTTMHDLATLYFERFGGDGSKSPRPSLTRSSLPPFQIEQAGTGIKYELEDVADLYKNCVLEARDTGDETGGRSKALSNVSSMLGTQKFVIVMVGLPARGKTFVARKLARYLNWLGLTTEVFNVGQYRRKRVGAAKRHSFFDANNKEGRELRTECALVALDDMMNFLHHEGGMVGVFDATNSTKERRAMILKRCMREDIQLVLFVEIVCTDESIVEQNIRMTKLDMPDYKSMAEDEAVADFKMRIAHYAAVYEPIEDEEGAYCKIINVGEKMIINRVKSYIPRRVTFFLQNLHTKPRLLFFTRHGESEYNVLGRIGGDSSLSERGEEYARRLAKFIDSHLSEEQRDQLVVWTSTLKRTQETGRHINTKKRILAALDEIDAGVCDGMTYDEISEKMPQEFASRAANKLTYRYPRGESYFDLRERLDPIILDVERITSPLLIIAHQAVLRVLLSYWLYSDSIERVPFLEVPLHQVVQVHPRAYGCDREDFKLLD